MIDIQMGLDHKVSRKLKRFTDKMVPNLIRGINKGTARLERAIKIEVVKGGSFRKRKGEPHIKNPGVHLRKGDGTLQSSWKMNPAKRTASNVEGSVSSNSPYSAAHEFGHGVPERSYVRPVIKREGGRVSDDIINEIVKPLGGPA